LAASPCPADAWAAAGGDNDAAANAWAEVRAAGIEVHLHGTPAYPVRLEGDHEAPAVLFSRGRVSALDPPLVSVVGTRRCTYTGRDVAAQFGRELAEAGVGVVSGLALGIDGAAHLGALGPPSGAGPVGVVGSGLDVVYPR